MHQLAIDARAMSMLPPDAALLLLTLGVLLIYLECNRPGWILTGALGLLAVLFGLASLLRLQWNGGAAILIITAIALLLLGLRRRTLAVVAIAATLALVLGLDHLIRPGQVHLHTSIATACGLVIGTVTSILTRIARRARTNKGLD